MRTLCLALVLCVALAGSAHAQTLGGGTITANGGAVTVSPGRVVESLSIQVTGTWTGTITFQGSTDGSNYVSLKMTDVTAGTGATTTTANGLFAISNSGFTSVRAIATAAWTGTATVRINEGRVLGGGGGGGGGSGCEGTSGTPCVVSGNGTAGTPDAGVVSIQGITSGTAVTVAPTAGSFASDGTFGAAVPATGPYIGLRAESTVPSAVTDGQQVGAWADLFGRVVMKTTDPCSDNALKQAYVVNLSSSGTTEFINGAGAGNYIYICSVNIVTAAANNILIAEDDTDNCGSISAGLNGGLTAGTGWNFAANSGSIPGGGVGWIMKSAGTNRFGCLLISASTQTSGTIVYALAP